MQKVSTAKDMSGRALEKGDTVCTLNGQVSGKIAELAQDDTTYFVRLRPVYQPYGTGTWHAADRVIWQSAGNKKKKDDKANDKKNGKTPAKTGKTSKTTAKKK